MPNAEYRCICCGRTVAYHQFKSGYKICALCDTQTGNEIAIMTFNTYERELQYRTTSAKGRREAKQIIKLEKLNATGKRCSACHHYKTVDQFGACATRGDGFQANCKACNKIRLTMISAGALLSQWHAVRDALRATANGPLNEQQK